ncbi:MAG: N-acetylmuramoyl-L-alanine amidase [Ruminococcaceae bacterium]|nr:N-acetylmuramoyl-L-alanine amidase [Oscillospiraceae bacterium]
MSIKVYIDQGHNPVNPNAGAEGNGFREQDIVFEIGVRLAALLDASGNYEARLSRPTPETQLGTSNTTSLAARTNDANAWGADYFISLHCNASADPSASGTEALVFSFGGRSYPLAQNILAGIVNATGLRNRGVKLRPGLYVLRKTVMPAILLELGFISNPGDAALLSGSPELFARGIFNGMNRYFGF